MAYDFRTQLEFSTGSRQIDLDSRALKAYFLNVESVDKTDPEIDKTGIDYIVTLKTGVQITVDTKTRWKGCSRYWKEGPELALEIWSQKWPPGSGREDVVGWTIDTRKQCDYIMFRFDPSDCKQYYILPFQQLNRATRHNYKEWEHRYGGQQRQMQTRADYYSTCIFVPAYNVMNAVKREFEADGRFLDPQYRIDEFSQIRITGF